MSISSVIITFQPDLSNVSQLLFACISFGNKAVVIDNGSNNAEELQDICRLFEHVKLIRLDENVGIASAQNIAISNLNGNEDDIIVFFDQDSSIDNGYLSKVELAYNRVESDFGRGIVLG
ncbi:glycosyltransferase, partial [Vibrio anguillarum]|nr:glycosyltransferase [Vibrio anguillarum]